METVRGERYSETVIDILINRVHHVVRVVTMNVHKRNIVRMCIIMLHWDRTV